MKEQHKDVFSKIGRGMAVAGLFLTGCGPSATELAKEPRLSQTTLKTEFYHIERLSQHVFRAVGDGLWKWDFEPSRDAAVQYIKDKCKVEIVIDPSFWEIRVNSKEVIVSNDDCLPEVK